MEEFKRISAKEQIKESLILALMPFFGIGFIILVIFSGLGKVADSVIYRKKED